MSYRWLSQVLRLGFYTGMVLMFAGFFIPTAKINLAKAGIEVLLATPIAFVGFVCVKFLFDRNLKYALIALFLLLLLVINTIFL